MKIIFNNLEIVYEFRGHEIIFIPFKIVRNTIIIWFCVPKNEQCVSGEIFRMCIRTASVLGK